MCRSIILPRIFPSPSFSYRPNLPVSYISHVLSFESEEDCLAFLISVDAVLVGDRTTVDCKLTQAKLSVAAATA